MHYQMKELANIIDILIGKLLDEFDLANLSILIMLYRWLRFPCCGKAFPCDACHELQTDHEAKVCPFSPKYPLLMLK